MPQNVLPFQYEPETQSTGLMDSAGLALYLELMAAIGLPERIEQRLSEIRAEQGWTSTQQIVSVILMQLAGGEALEHLDHLEQDEGVCEVLEAIEAWGQYPTHREALEKRWRIEKERTFPSPDAAGTFLKEFDSGTEQRRRQAEGAWVPEPSAELKQLKELVATPTRVAHEWAPTQTVTLDIDANVMEAHKRTAKATYKGYPGFQPLNVFVAEHGTVVCSEFRDGNCPAAWNNLGVLKQAEKHLPDPIDQLRLRADTAGYDKTLLKYCADPEAGEFSERFGRIEFGVGVDVTASFKQAVRQVTDWHPLAFVDEDGNEWETGHQWAWVPFVPDWLGYTKRDLGIRFLAIREPIVQQKLLEDEDQQDLSFPTMEFSGVSSKIFGMVTNRQDLSGDEIIRWVRNRCGWSEKVHSEITSGLAGGRLPFSDAFQANAAWWQISWLAYNLHVLMQRFGLGDELHFEEDGDEEPPPEAAQQGGETNRPNGEANSPPTSRRTKKSSSDSEPPADESSAHLGPRSPAIACIKTERFEIIRISGRVVRHAGTLRIRINQNHPALERIRGARRAIAHLAEQSARGPPNRWLPAA